jgi:hypothetical protein
MKEEEREEFVELLIGKHVDLTYKIKRGKRR